MLVGGGVGAREAGGEDFEEVVLPPLPPRRGARRRDSDLIRFSEAGEALALGGEAPPPHPPAPSGSAAPAASDAADTLHKQCAPKATAGTAPRVCRVCREDNELPEAPQQPEPRSAVNRLRKAG